MYFLAIQLVSKEERFQSDHTITYREARKAMNVTKGRLQICLYKTNLPIHAFFPKESCQIHQINLL